MKTSQFSMSSTNLTTIILGLLAAWLVFAVLTGRKFPLVSSDKAALLVLVVIGTALCTTGGIGRVAAANAWWHPLSILGHLLGAIILVVAIAGLSGIRLPWISDARQAFLAVAALSAIKIVLTTIHRFIL